jgi:hypothetical protein
MSDDHPTQTPTPTLPPTLPTPAPEPSWVKPSIGIFSFGVFAAALFVTWQFNKEAAFNLLIGAVIANVTTVIGYYFGSSSGSAQKTALLTPPSSDRGSS